MPRDQEISRSPPYRRRYSPSPPPVRYNLRSQRRKSRSLSSRRLKSRSPVPKRRKSRSPTRKRDKRQRKKSSPSSPFSESPSVSAGAKVTKDASEKIRKEDKEEKKRRRDTKMRKLGSLGHSHNPKTEEEQFQNLLRAKEKTTKIHIYVQDALGGSNPTVWEVARSVQTANSATSFGQVRVVDDLVTKDPDRNSEKLGRAQGVITFSDLQESALTTNMNFYFTAGEFKGSSLCIIGRNPIGSKNRELPVVGGTGIFRMARGYSISNTYSYDSVTNYGVIEYTFYVAYVDQEELDVELPKKNGK